MLHERSDFADLLVTVGETTETSPALVEKDYWVTEVLRVIAAGYSEGVIFKGGTSLSKGWGLIRRFSEDIDLLVRQDGSAGTSRNARDRYMKEIGAAVGQIAGLEPVAEGARSERGISRTVVFAYEPRTALLEGLRPTIMLEMGIRGGVQPAEQRDIRSMLSAALEGEIKDETLEPLQVTVLHARRTLVEKLFALHCACKLWTEGKGEALQRQGRHLYDVYFLLGDEGIAAFVGGSEYSTLISEIDRFGREYFPRDHRSPSGMRFASSCAFSPPTSLRAAIEDDYVRSAFLFYGNPPEFEAICERIDEFRDRL